MGVAALVLGIISVVFAVIGLHPVGVILGIIGIILGAIAKKKAQKCATAGLVLSIIGTALVVVLWLACAACVSAATGAAGLL